MGGKPASVAVRQVAESIIGSKPRPSLRTSAAAIGAATGASVFLIPAKANFDFTIERAFATLAALRGILEQKLSPKTRARPLAQDARRKFLARKGWNETNIAYNIYFRK